VSGWYGSLTIVYNKAKRGGKVTDDLVWGSDSSEVVLMRFPPPPTPKTSLSGLASTASHSDRILSGFPAASNYIYSL